MKRQLDLIRKAKSHTPPVAPPPPTEEPTPPPATPQFSIPPELEKANVQSPRKLNKLIIVLGILLVIIVGVIYGFFMSS